MPMNLVSTVTVGAGGAASIEFANIPQSGKDLLLLLSGRNTGASYNASNYVYFNSEPDSTSQSGRIVIGNGSTITNVSWSYSIRSVGATATANTFGNAAIYIANYAGSGQKLFNVESVSENNGTSADQALHGGLWSNTSPITVVKVGSLSGDFVQHSSASLYVIS